LSREGDVEPRTADPIGAAVEVLGDRWTLLVLRDIIFEDRRYFRALLIGSSEGIASNILADRLKRLLDAGILTRGPAGRGQRARFSLTEAGIQTVPVFSALGQWGLRWREGTDSDAKGDHQLMAELRERHLDAPSG
jgi:DNA-binding HxlR family transcriptional regulator